MSLDHLTNGLNQVKEIVNNITDFSKSLEKMFSGSTEQELTESKEEILLQNTQDIKTETQFLSDQIYEKERFKMIETLSKYITIVLSPQELKSFSDTFSGKTIEEDIIGYLYEQQYILQEQKKGNLSPGEALQKSFQMYDSTKKVESVLSDIGSFYFKQQGIERLTKTEEYFREKITTIKKPDASISGSGEKEKVVKDINVLPENIILENIVTTAKNELGVSEKDGSADKYFKDLGYKHNSKKTPWCGAFVSWVLEKNNLSTPTNNLSARAFIGEGGLGHVGIKVDGKVVSGNYGNKVSLATINKQIKGYAIPTSSGLDIINKKVLLSEIPEGAIVVYERNAKRSQAA